MTLSKKVTDKLEFIEILKSKHARYIHGAVIAKAEVAKNYVEPGAAMGLITADGHDSEGLYAPVTRAEVTASSTAENTVTVDAPWNFKVGDKVELINTAGAVISGENDREITGIVAKVITLNAFSTATNIKYIQKNDGSSKAKFICLKLVDVSDEDAIVGGITHGAVFKDRMVNFDAGVESDLPAVAFETEAIQAEQV